jgi:hypothetical protein
MIRNMCAPALALGAVLVANGFAAAQESGPAKSGPDSGFTMALGGTGTAAQAASADDTEVMHWNRRGYGYGGYRGYYGGGWGGGYYAGYGRGWGGGYYGGYGRGWGGGYGGGWGGGYYGGGWGGGYGGYRGYYNSYSVYRTYPVYYGGYGFYYGINGNQDDLLAPATNLGSSAKTTAVASRPTHSIVQPEGGFRYDGGPTNPVPLPKPDAEPTGQRKTEPATGLPVSLPKAKPASPYTYKAYGEK